VSNSSPLAGQISSMQRKNTQRSADQATQQEKGFSCTSSANQPGCADVPGLSVTWSEHQYCKHTQPCSMPAGNEAATTKHSCKSSYVAAPLGHNVKLLAASAVKTSPTAAHKRPCMADVLVRKQCCQRVCSMFGTKLPNPLCASLLASTEVQQRHSSTLGYSHVPIDPGRLQLQAWQHDKICSSSWQLHC